ncbi:polyadenylate-binding protein 1-B [Thraustotheca clavata]|uniref:Polyadenylate-binding protein n=1 Tax=Thraustotheca clavata TaxID=74557 RepID=A0A1W0A5T7_9STRA|nr:polyadenylate-binding protein 1-B [Thraustotheca clavata]
MAAVAPSSPVPTPAAPVASPQPFHTASLYVGDIHPDVTEALLFEIFNAVGPVASIRVCRDAVTRRSLGYAYVNFHNVSDAERALDTMNYTSIKGVPCRIMWSQRDPSLRKSGVGNIFVKNLDPSIDNKALYDTFSLFGNILSCKVAIDNTSGGSKGYGYVHYETAEAANEAIAKINGMLIAGSEVFVGHFQKRQDRPDLADWTNCYVKNIPHSWDDATLRKEFEPFGSITSCVVMKDASSEGNRGFGFVNFDDPESARKAVEALNEKIVAQDDGADVALYVGKAQKRSERERELRQKFDLLKMERINKYQGVNLYVKNLDDQLNDDELREAFAGCGTITSCRIMKDPTGNSRGFGFVCFATPEEATKAVTDMNGKIVSGKPIYVALAQRKEVRRAQLEAQHAQQRASGMVVGRGMPMQQPPMYGAAPMFYAQPNQMPPQGRQGFVYPQQMMPRGGMPRGPMPYRQPGAPAGYGMPQYGGMPMQPQQRQPRGRRPQGQVPAQMQPNQRNNRNNFKYTANARNQPAVQEVPVVAGMEPLTSAALAAASPGMQKNMIGERLFPLIEKSQPELAGKITGMLLEMDNGELLHLLESPEALDSKIAEAIAVLEAHLAAEE